MGINSLIFVRVGLWNVFAEDNLSALSSKLFSLIIFLLSFLIENGLHGGILERDGKIAEYGGLNAFGAECCAAVYGQRFLHRPLCNHESNADCVIRWILCEGESLLRIRDFPEGARIEQPCFFAHSIRFLCR